MQEVCNAIFLFSIKILNEENLKKKTMQTLEISSIPFFIRRKKKLILARAHRFNLFIHKVFIPVLIDGIPDFFHKPVVKP